jgi:7-cyano-7-deazaguanine synthase in queuosine biosynthesis
MTGELQHIVLCNDAEFPKKINKKLIKDILKLYHAPGNRERNVNIQLPDFVGSVYHLPDRVKDLLEIAAYIYAADRKTHRGTLNAVEYQKWDRSFHFVFPVRDFGFWNRVDVQTRLSEALQFMSGDKSYEFTFQQIGAELPMGLFDQGEFKVTPDSPTSIILFSGGLDSLTGVVDRLKNTNENICLMSHQSGQPESVRTQKKLIEALNQKYGKRCSHFKFFCNLIGERAVEETQRTRSFLYGSIAFALAGAFSQDCFYFYENGITSINFSKRQDLINARASRTTHPKTLGLLEKFLSLFRPENPIKILHPYLFKTKTDVVSTLVDHGERDLISSSVSCSKTFQNTTQNSHCGQCSQCVDRRFAMYSTAVEDYDEQGIYGFDFLKDELEDGKTKTTLIDYVRLALKFSQLNQTSFQFELLDELVNLDDYIEGANENERLEKIYVLCHRHGEQIETALERMRSKHDRPFTQRPDGTFLKIIANKDYLKPPVELLVQEICDKLKKSLPIAFENGNKPKDERALNSMINALIEKDKENYKREYPSIRFALANTIPDHSLDDLFIEAKYLRGKTSPSKATEGIAADLTKYPTDKHKLFIVYDPERSISDDDQFMSDFHAKGRCNIFIIR